MAKRQPPLDPRLVTHVRSARRHIVTTVAVGLVEAVCVIVLAWALGQLGSLLLEERSWPHEHPWLLATVGLSLAVRASATWVLQRTGHRAATETISELRLRVARHRGDVSVRHGGESSASIATLATAGLENLRPYLTGYVPQLALSATLTPLALAAIAWWDLTSAIVACIAIPLIPVFMILIGTMTEGASERSLGTMRSLWSSTLDLIEGLPTLRALNRAQGSERIVERLGREHKNSAMRTLAFAFLSSFALELIATLGVALIAVSIGLRLVSGGMEIAPAISVLVLAAEVYLPLRNVGAQFHASTDGLAALDAAFEVLDTPRPAHGTRPCPYLATSTIVISDLSVRGRNGWAPHRLNARIAPGSITALTGASGSGKSTTIAALLGLLAPDLGDVRIEGPEGSLAITDIDPASLWAQVSWLPQRPLVGPGSLRELVADGRPAQAVAEAASATGLDTHVIDVHGWDYPVGRGGEGLSVGQRQRLALTLTLIDPKPLVILDEPTAHLDGASERMIVDVIERMHEAGSTVLVVAHRDTLINAAGEVIEVRASRTDPAPLPAGGTS